VCRCQELAAERVCLASRWSSRVLSLISSISIFTLCRAYWGTGEVALAAWSFLPAAAKNADADPCLLVLACHLQLGQLQLVPDQCRNCSDVTLIRSLAERSGAAGPTRAGSLIQDLGLFQWMELPALPGGDLI
jgi:hypothetical protein